MLVLHLLDPTRERLHLVLVGCRVPLVGPHRLEVRIVEGVVTGDLVLCRRAREDLPVHLVVAAHVEVRVGLQVDLPDLAAAVTELEGTGELHVQRFGIRLPFGGQRPPVHEGLSEAEEIVHPREEVECVGLLRGECRRVSRDR